MDFYTFIVCLSIILPFWYFVYSIGQFLSNSILQNQFNNDMIEPLMVCVKNVFESYSKIQLRSFPF